MKNIETKMEEAIDFLNKEGYAAWFQEHIDGGGETVINYNDCLEAMVKFSQEAIKNYKEENYKFV